MGVDHLKFGRSRMRGNSLSHEIFKGVNCKSLSFFETSLGVAFSLPFDLCWVWTTFFPPVYLSQPADL